MHDIKTIESDPKLFDEGLNKRGLPARSAELLQQYKAWRENVTKLEALQAQRNRAAKAVADAKKRGDKVSHTPRAGNWKQEIAASEERNRVLQESLSASLSLLPNTPDRDVPEGADESCNKQLRSWRRRRDFAFSPLSHDALGAKLQAMDFPRAAKIAGARFVLLYGELARLERALATFMLDLHCKSFGYREVSCPVLVKESVLFGSGHLPKFREDLFATDEGEPRFLIPTAETVLTNLHSDEILEESALPLRYVSWTPCFRSEAGAGGKDTRGMIRVHQFSKVELVSITDPESSEQELERMTSCAEQVLQQLELPYRVVLLCCGDMGFSARKTYDLEVWFPSQETYREISSCSNCGGFQSRRMGSRFRRKAGAGGAGGAGGGKPKFTHALNGSGLAVGRTLAALLENRQEPDGSVSLPKALRPYMGGEEQLLPPKN